MTVSGPTNSCIITNPTPENLAFTVSVRGDERRMGRRMFSIGRTTYLPEANTITIDPTALQTFVQARWFDPANGQFRQVSGKAIQNTKRLRFQTPGKNSAGDADWVLFLKTRSQKESNNAPLNEGK